MVYSRKNIVVFGASANQTKYGYKIFHTLSEHGLSVYGINPKGGEADGHAFYKTLSEVPVTPDVAIMVIPPAALTEAVEQCIVAHVSEIWFQPGARDASAFERAIAAGMQARNDCFMVENGFW